jgi:hypothetical protein
MRPIRRMTIAIAMTFALGATLITPLAASGAERHEDYGRHGDERMRHEREWREHHHPRGYVVQPTPVYAPPVVYAPPPPVAPGFTIVFPIHFH